MKIRVLLTAILLFLLSVNTYAVGESGALFLLSNSGARPASMAGVFIGKADDVNAIWYNPAGLARLSENQVVATYNSGIVDISSLYVAAGVPMESVGTVGFVAAYSGMPELDNPGDYDEAVAAYDMAGIFSYAYNFTGDVSAGINLKLLSSRLGDYSSGGVGFDAGALYSFSGNFSAGIVLQNIGTSLKFDEDDTPLPLRGGIGINAGIVDTENHKVSVGTDVLYYISDSYISGGIGAEYCYSGLLSVRAGYKIEEDSLSSITAGAGINFELNDMKVGINYAFLPMIWGENDISAAQFVSVIVSF